MAGLCHHVQATIALGPTRLAIFLIEQVIGQAKLGKNHGPALGPAKPSFRNPLGQLNWPNRVHFLVVDQIHKIYK